MEEICNSNFEEIDKVRMTKNLLTCLFNNFRKNRNRDNKTPKDIFIMEGKKDLIKKLNIKPIIIDDYIKDIQKISQSGYFYRLQLIR